MTAAPASPGRRIPRRFHFARHLGVFAGVVGTALLAEFLLDASWDLYWPVFVWGVLLAIHYFIASSFDVDDAWVEERIGDLQTRSYDFDHIRNIEKRIGDKDHSVTPHTERDS